MKLTTLFLPGMLAATTTACPGQLTGRDLEAEILERASVIGPNDSYEMIGDLATKGATTSVGKSVQNILLGTEDPYSDVGYNNILWPKWSSLCKADTCCIWKHIAQDMEYKFRGPARRCNGFARAAVRLGFHDAGAWSKTSGWGGADGSLILAGEVTRPENHGLEEIVAVMQGWYNDYKEYGVGMADLIQMGATVATVVCPLGPRIRSFVGRKDSSRPGPNGLLPPVTGSAESLIALFQDKTIMPHGLAALVGAHTTSQQRFVDPSRALDPQDSTPGVWDVKFYPETTSSNSPKRVFKFQSDVVLSQHPKISDEWAKFSQPNGAGQDHWNEDFSKEYVRLSLLGVNNINDLKECTKVLPSAIKSFRNPDQDKIDQWLAGGLPQVGQALRDAVELTVSFLAGLGIKIFWA
ncbi:heme peroxidase [Halenospora varia]|nr:heme peroxidase [Halenospora varia]